MTVNIFGATGLIGNLLLQACLESDQLSQVTIFVRKPTGLLHPKLREVVATYETLDKVGEEIKGNVVFNCLGTTLKQAGSQMAQYTIDCEYPVKIAQIAAKNGIKCMVNVSSVGADESGNFYLRTKAAMERGVREAIGPKSYFLRPSLLVGERKELRFGEKIGIYAAAAINPLLWGSLRKYRSISAEHVANAMLRTALEQPEGPTILHYDEIMR
jgi:uncharacterized protein YbjT (DUF2867 family)